MLDFTTNIFEHRRDACDISSTAAGKVPARTNRKTISYPVYCW
jgi:hypothetical protein